MRFLSLLLFSFTAFTAYGLPEFIPSQERALGHSLAGGNTLNDSLYSNPAGSAFSQVYSIQGTYQPPKTFEVSILDTKTNDFGGALGYFRHTEKLGDEPIQGAKIALMGQVMESLGVGLAGKMLWGPSLGGRNNMKDVDAGLLARFQPVTLGFTARNLFGGAPEIGQRTEWALGGQINWQQLLFFSVSTTGVWEGFKPYQIGFGAEYVTPYHFSIKGGYRAREGQAFWSAGASLLAPRITIHYSVEFQPSGSPEHLFATMLLF